MQNKTRITRKWCHKLFSNCQCTYLAQARSIRDTGRIWQTLRVTAISGSEQGFLYRIATGRSEVNWSETKQKILCECENLTAREVMLSRSVSETYESEVALVTATRVQKEFLGANLWVYKLYEGGLFGNDSGEKCEKYIDLYFSVAWFYKWVPLISSSFGLDTMVFSKFSILYFWII